MPRDLKAHENQKRARARREGALARREFAYPSEPRQPATGPTSFPVKKIDAAAEIAIAEFLARQRGDR